MEKKKKNEEKNKKDAAQKKVADLKTKVPEPAKPGPHHPSANPTHPSTSSGANGGNGKRTLPGAHQTASAQQQSQPSSSSSSSSSSGPRYPPREVPPRFRQQEHKQLLKRGQPLPAGSLSSLSLPASASGSSPSQEATPSLSTASSPSGSASKKRHSDLSLQSGLGAQYENPHWGAPPPPNSNPSNTSSSWDQVIIDGSDTNAWPSISRSGADRRPAPPECPSATSDDALNTSSTNASTSSSRNMSMAAGAASQQAHYPSSLKANANASMMAGPGAAVGSRGWGLEGKPEGAGMSGGRAGAPGWNPAPNFNLNLNPNANPSAWPALGHEGGGMGSGSSNPQSVQPGMCGNQAGNATGNGGLGGDGGGGGDSWGGMMSPDTPSPNSNVSFNMEQSSHNMDGGHHHAKQQPNAEPMSPIHGLPGWGGQSPTESSQLNGDTGSSIWGNGDSKTSGNDSSSKDSGWDSAPSGGLPAWGRGGNGSGGSGGGGWGDWGGKSGGGGNNESKGWDSPSDNAGADQSLTSWGQQPGTAPTSEGSGGSSEGHGHRRERSSSMDIQPPPLPRQDLDPRVLCNTGWGQTPVRQHTAWEMEEAAAAAAAAAATERKDSNGTIADNWCSPNGPSPGPPPPPTNGGPGNPNMGAPQRPGSGGKNDSQGGSSSGWGGPPPQQTQSGWGEPAPASKTPNGTGGGWGGEPMPCGPSATNNGPKNGPQSWGSSEDKSPTWEDGPGKPQSQTWGEGPKASQGWGNGSGGSNSSSGGGGEWREPAEGKKNSTSSGMWDGENGGGGGGGGGGGWKDSPRRNNGNGGWAKPAPAVGGNWGETPRPNGPPAPGWGGKPQDAPNGGGVSGGGMGTWGGPATVKQSSSWGGGGGGGGKQDPGMEPTGWEEPSPPSIRRKMEIDDGTSTWGDPNAYNKTVNMWDKNNPNGHQGNSHPPPTKNGGGGGGGMVANSNHHSVPPGNNNNNHHHHHLHHHSHHGPPPAQPQHHGNNNGSPNTVPPHQGGAPQGRPPLANPGWGELPSAQPKPEPAWGEPATPAPSVDNGTSAWGKPPGGVGSWGDGGHEPSGPYGRSNGPSGSAPCKPVPPLHRPPAPKPMQDGWSRQDAGEEMDMPSGQWDADNGDMWSSPASQDSSSSWGNQPKKGPPKGKMPFKSDEAWIMNRLIKQLTDMGFLRDPAEEALKSNNMNLDQAMTALLEKKTELDKRGMGMSDYNNGMNKPLLCRPPALSKDPSSDRSPFMDKDGVMSDDAPSSPFLPSPSLKLPMSGASLQAQGLGVGTQGLAMQNLNNRQMQSGMFGSSGAAQVRPLQQQPPQPSVPSLSSSQPLRAQVPQLLSPQVQAQLLQFAAKNIGLNPALLTSPINPQQMTLLYQLQQLQMAYQRLQIQQQMMQAQRSVSGPIRQQEQQVARTINNMQQQIQQHQRQLYQALLMKHQSPSSHPGLHSSGSAAGKSSLDSFSGHSQASLQGLHDLQTKDALQSSSPNSYSHYPLSGLNPNMNVCMEVGGLSMKDPPQPQSRLSQWTHPNSMDSSSHMETNLNKHGAMSSASNLGPPGGKASMDDSYSPYGLMGSSDSPTSPLVPSDSWGQTKSPNDKISNGSNITWPPEFCPGVPWKGLQNIDPENDPNMTPGSVPSGPTINTNIQDVNRYLLRDRSGGKLSDMKSTWSAGPASHSQASLSHELWKVPQGPRNTTAPSRPPPGLTNTKPPPSSTWGGNSLGLAQGWSHSYTSDGATWSTDSSNRTSSWLVLRNLTPQIDGSTLRTLCMQHGPLITFHLSLTQGNALVRYSSKEEADKAQKSLHMCVLGNTTILAEFAGEEEVNRFFAQGQSLAPPTTSWQANPGTNHVTRMGGGASQSQHAIGHWSGGGGIGGKTGGGGGGDLLWGGVPQYSSLWGPPGGDDGRVMGSPTPINTLLPGDLLSGESV